MDKKEKEFDDLIDAGAEIECLFEDLEPICKKLDALIEEIDDYKKYDYKNGTELVNAGFDQIKRHYDEIKKIFENNKSIRKKVKNEDYNKIYNMKLKKNI